MIFFYLANYGRSRMDLHYLAPYLPFYLVFAGIFLENLFRLRQGKKIAMLIIALSISGLTVLAGLIDYEFYNDTRGQAREWIIKNIPADSQIEITDHLFQFPAPYQTNLVFWYYHMIIPPEKIIHLGSKCKNLIAPGSANSTDTEIQEYEKESQKQLQDYLHRFSEAELKERNPDYIIASSHFYDRYLKYQNRYPSTKKYWEELLDEKYGYKIIKRFSPPGIIRLTTALISPEIIVLKKE